MRPDRTHMDRNRAMKVCKRAQLFTNPGPGLPNLPKTKVINGIRLFFPDPLKQVSLWRKLEMTDRIVAPRFWVVPNADDCMPAFWSGAPTVSPRHQTPGGGLREGWCGYSAHWKMLPMKFPVFLGSLGEPGIIRIVCFWLRFYVLLAGMEFAALHICRFLGRSMKGNQDGSPSTFRRNSLIQTIGTATPHAGPRCLKVSKRLE